MPSAYYHEVESKLVYAEQTRASLSRVMESVDKNRLTQDEYDELFSLY